MARMLGDDPPYLEVGTEVSAKYRGAFCEAKVRKVVKQVKAKVNLKLNMGSVVVGDDQVKGLLQVGATVEVKHPEKGQVFEGVVTKILDSSQYTVVFDDGDITTLRRTSLHRKSGRHFTEAESLDHLPLTHPEHFSNPVRQRRRGKANHSDDSSVSESDSDGEGTPTKRQARKAGDWLQMVGKVVSVEVDTNKKKKDNWFPALVVVPTAQIDARRDLLVRSFQDGRYYTVPKKEASSFQRDFQPKNNAPLKTAIEKAVNYLERDELPPHWDRDALFGSNDSETNTTASDSESSDEETREEKDHFVAQLYKFMDDRGTPINRAPTVGARDLDLHKLWRVVQKQGGYNKVTNQNVWKTVGSRLTQDAGSPVNSNSVKVAYKRYLLHFEEFQRKLGCTLVSHTRGNKVRSSSGRSLIRERDRTASSGGGSPAPAPAPASPPPPAPAPAPAPAAPRTVRERTPATASSNSPSPAPLAAAAVKAEPVTGKKTAPAARKKAAGEVERKRAGSLERRGSLKKNDVKDVKREPLAEEQEVKKEEATKETETKAMRTRNKESESTFSASPAPSDKSDKTSAKPEAAAATAAKTSRERRPSHRAEKASPAPAAAAAPLEKTQENSAVERRRSGPVKRRKDESPDDDDPETLPAYVDVQVGDKVSVLYKINSKKERTIYEAKVLQLDPTAGARRYFIHYLNWNKRYDEWVKRNRIIENLSWAPTRARRNSRVEAKVPPAAASAGVARGGRSPALATARSTTPAPEAARTPAASAPTPTPVPNTNPNTAKTEPEKKNNARKGSVAASDSEETEPPTDGGDDTRVPTRRRLQRQRSTPGRSTDEVETGKATPPRRGSRRNVRRRGDDETPGKASTATSLSSSSETRADDEDSGVGEERTVAGEGKTGDKATVVEADSTSEPAAAGEASSPAQTAVASPLEPARGAVSDIYEFTDECDDGFVTRDTPTKLKSVINTYGNRSSRSPAAASDSPAPPAIPTVAAGGASVAPQAGNPPAAPVQAAPASLPAGTPSPSPGKKRKLTNKDTKSPMASPAKAAKRAPVRPAGARTPSPRRPAKKRTAAACQQPPQPMLAVTKLTDYQLSRVTLVKASSLRPLSPPPPRLQPATAASPQYKPPVKAEAGAASTAAVVTSVPAPAPSPGDPPVVTAPPLTLGNRVSEDAVASQPPPPFRTEPSPAPAPVIKQELKQEAPSIAVKPSEQRSAPMLAAGVKPSTSPPPPPPPVSKIALFWPPAVSRTSPPAVARAATLVTRTPAPQRPPAPAPPRAPAPAPVPPRVSAPAAPPPRPAAPPPRPAAPAAVLTRPRLPVTSAPTVTCRKPPAPTASSPPSSSGCTVSPDRDASGEPAAKRPPRWPSETEPSDSAERRVAALQSPVKPPCDLTCRETIPGSPERVEGGGRPACSSEPERALEMPFASLPSGVAPAAVAGQPERARRQLTAPSTPDGSDAGSTGSKRESARVSPSGQSPGSLVSSDAEQEPPAAASAAAARQSQSPSASPAPEVNGLVRSLSAASLPAGRGLRSQPPPPPAAAAAQAAAVEPANTRQRRRTRRRRRRLSARSGRGVSDSDEVLERSNGDPADHGHADKPHKYNFLVTFEESEGRETRISVLTEQIEKLRDKYSSVNAELGRVNRRIKKLKKKQREAPAPPAGDGVKKLRPSFVTP